MPLADVSHFSMIGFELDIASGDRFQKSLEKSLDTCRISPLGETQELCIIKDASGAELWIGLKRHADGTAEIVTANPAFAGEGRAAVEIDAAVPEPGYAPYEYRVSARLGPDKVPMVFDLADPGQFDRLKPGEKLTVNLSGFAYEPEIHEDEAAYVRAQRKRAVKVQFAPDFFIPIGSFLREQGGMADEGPTAYAALAGTVLKAELRSNGATTGHFWWTLLRTYGGITIDVVIDPRSIRSEIKPGAVVTGDFWLSGRVATARPE